MIKAAPIINITIIKNCRLSGIGENENIAGEAEDIK